MRSNSVRSSSFSMQGLRWTAAIASIVLATSSCIINTGSHTKRTGSYISQQTFEQVAPGKKKEFVVAVLGEPSTKTTLSDGTEIWKWMFRQKETRSGTVLFVFSGDDTTETETSTYVLFKDDVVTQAWRD
jgi:outer membrane protein assembly factor BamE (lipoprotein component of BamABCDE complex)